MNRLFFNYIPTALAMAFGIVTLAAFLVPAGPLVGLRSLFVSWASVLAAFALIAGFLNVLGVHIGRVASQKHNWPYSVALLLGVIAVIGTAVADIVKPGGTGRLDPGGENLNWLFQNVIVQLEIAVAALVVFFLAYAAYRALRRPTHVAEGSPAAAARPAWGIVLFLLAALVMLLRAVSFVTDTAVLSVQSFFGQLVDSVALGGARGLLIGVALGTIATGLRILAGVDRPHSE
jgi:hypothetical protein